jgi:uncharacterized protein
MATALMTSAELQRSDAVVPDWVRAAHRQYREVILDPRFPCYFGTKAEAQGHMRFAYVRHDRDPVLPRALAEFVDFSRAHPTRRHVFIVFFPPGPDDFAAQTCRFWDNLQWLHEQDPQPWPAQVPADPDEPAWEFCFAGDPMFAFPCLPAYRRRLSRRMGDGFAMCFQPRRVFFGVNRDDPGGERIRADIYARVARWDRVPPHPDLVDQAYGDPTMREWKQYVLPDDNGELRSRCPFHMTGRSAR